MLGTFGTPGEVEDATVETVTFHPSREWRELPLEQVPPRVFSEVMRDLDLVVSVAHSGGVDPETSASGVEVRARLVDETCDLLGLSNVETTDHHALVKGSLATYSVNLGLGVVHRQPGAAVCIIPVSAQHRGRLPALRRRRPAHRGGHLEGGAAGAGLADPGPDDPGAAALRSRPAGTPQPPTPHGLHATRSDRPESAAGVVTCGYGDLRDRRGTSGGGTVRDRGPRAGVGPRADDDAARAHQRAGRRGAGRVRRTPAAARPAARDHPRRPGPGRRHRPVRHRAPHPAAAPADDVAVARAVEAFDDGLYYVVVDGAVVSELDAPLTLTADSRLRLVRLVALAGG